MRVGVCLPQVGNLADPNLVPPFAAAVERAGYHSLWVMDRLLTPIDPKNEYPGVGKDGLPPEMQIVLDPIGVLTVAALATSRVRLGTSVLVGPWYPPVLLARALTTLDLVSRGRLTIGLGLGWSADEYEAAGVPMTERGGRYDDLLAALQAIWTDDVVAVQRSYVRIAPAVIRPKPVQPGGPPVLLGLYGRKGLDRVARQAAGWNPNGLPIPQLREGWAYIRSRAVEFGRDPDEIELVVGANIKLTDRPIEGPDRTMYFGTIEQVADDLDATRRAGAHEVILGEWEDPKSVEESLGPIESVVAQLDCGISPVLPIG
jgi:probable F420-dependent oxidoreductase